MSRPILKALVKGAPVRVAIMKMACELDGVHGDDTASSVVATSKCSNGLLFRGEESCGSGSVVGATVCGGDSGLKSSRSDDVKTLLALILDQNKSITGRKEELDYCWTLHTDSQ